MIRVNIVAVGRLKESYFEEAVAEFMKRCSRFCDIRCTEIPDGKSPEQEGEEILKKLSGCVVCCDVRGNLISSEDLADIIQKKCNTGKSEITFVIGGSEGLSEQVKQKAEEKISFGRVTFPHRLMRVILCEQIYRAFTIMMKMPYHK